MCCINASQSALTEAVDARDFGREARLPHGCPGRLLQLMDNNIAGVIPSILPQPDGIYWISSCEVSKRACLEAWTLTLYSIFRSLPSLGNVRMSRTILLLLLIEGVMGIWLVEQPSSSLLFESDRFRWLVCHLESLGMRAFCLKYRAGRIVQFCLHARFADLRSSASGSS